MGISPDIDTEHLKQVVAQALPEVAKPPQVAEYVQTSVAALAQDRYRGRGIPFVKIAGRVRYLRQDVIKYLESQRMTQTGGGGHAA